MNDQRNVFVLNGTGHITITWDHESDADRERARGEVEELRAAGYSFFAVEGAVGINEIEKGQGHLVVKKIEQICDTPPIYGERSDILDTQEPNPSPSDEPPKKRGRPKGSTNKPKGPAPTQHVALPRMGGG